MKRLSLFIFTVFSIQCISAQQSQLDVKFIYNGNLLNLDKNYYNPQVKDSVVFNAIKCYFSEIVITDITNQRITLDTKHMLVDLEDPRSCSIQLPKNIAIASIDMTVGVDSTTNADAVMSGDLDPINGMYWAWQSGFINWKIEGKCSSLATRNHVFQYHIGGFLPPFQTTRFVSLKNTDPNQTVSLVIDLSVFMSKINLMEVNEVMSPSQTGMELADLFSSLFLLVHE